MKIFFPARLLLAGIWILFGLSMSSAMAERDATEIVTQAYEDILGRKPDAGGLREYRCHIIDDGWSEEDVRNDLKKSEEYTSKKADRIIKDAYQDLLGRKPDGGGLANYRKHIAEDGWSEEDVRNDLRNSAEYKKKHGD